MKGRKPKPSGMKRAEGNPGKRPINGAEPQPQSKAVAPKHLKGEALRLWDTLAPELESIGVLAGIDTQALCCYCESWALYVKACGKILKRATIVTDKGNEVQSPWVGIRNTQMDHMRKFAVEFGLTPSSRSRLSVGGAGAKSPEQDLADFMAAPASAPQMKIAQ